MDEKLVRILPIGARGINCAGEKYLWQNWGPGLPMDYQLWQPCPCCGGPVPARSVNPEGCNLPTL